MFPLPVKHLYNVKNKSIYFYKKTSFIIVRKRDLLEANTVSAFCLLPHYQTPGMYKWFQKYFHWQVRTSAVTRDQCFSKAEHCRNNMNTVETIWTFSYQLPWEFLQNWQNQPNYWYFPMTILYFLNQNVNFMLTYIKLQRHLFLCRKRTNGHPLLTFIRHYQHHTAIFAPPGNHKHLMKEKTIKKKKITISAQKQNQESSESLFLRLSLHI